MKLLTLRETSHLLDLHPTTVTKHTQRGKLPGLLLGRRCWRFPEAVLHLWLAMEQENRTAAGLRARIEADLPTNVSANDREAMWSVQQVARFLRVSPLIVYRYLTPDNEFGTIPAIKIGNRWRVSRNVLESWLVEEVLRSLGAIEKRDG
jgi:hypothetical protein